MEEITTKKSRKIWCSDAETLLIDIWQHKIDELRGVRKNTHIYQEMAAELQMYNFEISSVDVKIKIANLTAKYRKCKAEVGPSGGSPAEWVHFNRVHQIIGGFTINNMDVVVEDSIQDLEIQILTAPPRSPSSFTTPPTSPSPMCSSVTHPPSPLLPPTPVPPSSSSTGRSRVTKKNKDFEKLLQTSSEMNTNFNYALSQFNDSNEELVKIELEKLTVIKDIQNDSKRLTDGFLEFLRRFD